MEGPLRPGKLERAASWAKGCLVGLIRETTFPSPGDFQPVVVQELAAVGWRQPVGQCQDAAC